MLNTIIIKYIPYNENEQLLFYQKQIIFNLIKFVISNFKRIHQKSLPNKKYRFIEMKLEFY